MIKFFTLKCLNKETPDQELDKLLSKVNKVKERIAHLPPHPYFNIPPYREPTPEEIEQSKIDREAARTRDNSKFRFTGKKIIFEGKEFMQIRATRDNDFHGIREGDFGGWITHANCLDEHSDAWVGGDAKLSGKIRDAALITGNAIVMESTISGNAIVRGNAEVRDSALLGDVIVEGDAAICDSNLTDAVHIYGTAELERVDFSGIMSIGTGSLRGLYYEQDENNY